MKGQSSFITTRYTLFWLIIWRSAPFFLRLFTVSIFWQRRAWYFSYSILKDPCKICEILIWIRSLKTVTPHDRQYGLNHQLTRTTSSTDNYISGSDLGSYSSLITKNLCCKGMKNLPYRRKSLIRLAAKTCYSPIGCLYLKDVRRELNCIKLT